MAQVNVRTVKGEGIVIELLEQPGLLIWNMRGAGITEETGSSMRDTADEVLHRLLSPAGLRADGNRIVTNYSE